MTFQSRTGFPGHSDDSLERCTCRGIGGFNPERASQAIPTAIARILRNVKRKRFNPERASQAIPTRHQTDLLEGLFLFQSRHSDIGNKRGTGGIWGSFNPERASQAIPTCFAYSVCPSKYGFNPERASQAIPTATRPSAAAIRSCFNPERASQAIPTRHLASNRWYVVQFQSRTGFPGHSDPQCRSCLRI